MLDQVYRGNAALTYHAMIDGRSRNTGPAYAPAAGRLAAAMATISARRRPIRDRVERNNEFNCRMSIIPGGSAETFVSETKAWNEGMGFPRWGVEATPKIAMRPPSDPTGQQIHCCDATGNG